MGGDRGLKGNEHAVSHPKISWLKWKAPPRARTGVLLPKSRRTTGVSSEADSGVLS